MELEAGRAWPEGRAWGYLLQGAGAPGALGVTQGAVSKPADVAFRTPAARKAPWLCSQRGWGAAGACPLRPRAHWGEMSPLSPCGPCLRQNVFLCPWLATVAKWPLSVCIVSSPP